MQTSLYKITFRDGRIYNVFCANKKQNKDMIRFLSSPYALKEVKRHGAIVVECGIHDFKQFEKILSLNK